MERGFGYWVRVRRLAAGLTQRALAAASGVKQPLIAAIEAGSRPASEATRHALEQSLQVRPSALVELLRDDMVESVARLGGRDPLVFGSVARGDDLPDSDLDLLVTFTGPASLLDLLELEEELSSLLTVEVDVASATSSSPAVRDLLADAVAL